MKKIASFLLAALFILWIPLNASAQTRRVVNIISHSLMNGAGKQVDVAIIKHELEKFSCEVNLCDYYKVSSVPQADINIFLAQTKPEWFHRAKLNWFIPNAEFCTVSLDELKSFDLILCKTQEALRIFEPICNQVFYLGFTSIDRYRAELSEKKTFSEYLHVAGKSLMKGTGAIIKAWDSHPRFPKLTLIKHNQVMEHPLTFSKNVHVINTRVSNDSLLNLQNKCGVHLCTSKTEGFGHYIMEAMSVGAVVVTTDGPPMNEFITDDRFLVKCRSTEAKGYATLYNVHEEHLAGVIKNLQKLSPEELKLIGQKNRDEFKKRAIEFKQNFKKMMQTAEHQLSR